MPGDNNLQKRLQLAAQNCLRLTLLILGVIAYIEASIPLASAAKSTSTDTAANTSSDTPVFHGDIPAFEEQAMAAGITHRYEGPWEYFVGGGVSSFDCNGDRMPELFIAGGQNPTSLYINESLPGKALRFRKSDDQSTMLTGVLGSYPIDIDNDGYLDLAVLRLGENLLLKGSDNCSFKAANALWGFDGGNAWSTAFSASFETDSSFPTLAMGNYVDRTAPGSPWGTCHDNELHRPTQIKPGTHSGDKATPNYSNRQLLSPGYCALSMLFTDWNRSGSDALRITNDRHYYRGGEEQMWRVDKERYPRLYRRADGWAPLVIWGMGIAETDLDADGFPEYALTSMGDTKLQVLDVQQAIDENRPAYEDIAWTRNATAHRPYTGDDLKPSTGWHAQFDDVNNDARLDLYIAKGNVENMQDFAQYDPDNLLLSNSDGSFSEQGEHAGLAADTRGRGANVLDLNADGMLDIVVVNRNDNVGLFRHTGMQYNEGTRQGGNWLKVELRQNGSNRFAVGARLSIKTGNLVQSRRVSVGGGHASGMAGFVHVGLGVAERATVRVQWPDGQWSAPFKLFANRHVIINRDQDAALQWFPVTQAGY